MLKLVIVAVLVAVTNGHSDSEPYSKLIPRPRVSQQCAGYCKDSSKFSLQPGSTYVYNYEGTTISGVAGASNETSEIKVTAKAHIQIDASPCELILQVREVQLYDSGAEGLESAIRQREFIAALEENPLRFSFQDGRVEQICPSTDEPTWVLNIKRGLLSVFQNSMVDFSKDAHLYERDISGICETTYSVKPMMWSNVKILKRKNLQSCSGRSHQTMGLSGSFPSKAKSVPLVKSEQFCEQTIKTDEGTYLTNVRCQETHVFAPFSNRESGIITTVALSLSLDSIIKTVDPFITDIFVNKRTNLQFDFSIPPSYDIVTLENVWNTLNQLIGKSQDGVGVHVPSMFDQLVKQLSALDDQQLVKLFDEQREKRARQFLLDALPLVGSTGSVKAMYQIYTAQEVTRDELDSWLTALAFQKEPTLDMLETLQLFMQDGFHPKTWLAVSSVVYSYCQLDSTCADKTEVQSVMSVLEGTLGDSCHSSSTEQQQVVVVALKAIGNAGFVYSLDTLKRCFELEHNPMEVRIAAVSATRRFTCNKLLQLPMLQLFQDGAEDAELRIAAYLATIQCPSTDTISKLRDSLYQEDTNQVLSFVWTHLTNLQESTSSWRKEVRQMLQDNYLAKKFRTDVRKFSRNYEMSLYSDILSTGVTADSNIVFSTKSYLPRSATLNLTLDLFGEPVNIFEVGTRLEGFESVIEDIFSPKGYFPDESMQKMLKNMRNGDNEKNEVIQSFSDQFVKGTKNIPQGTLFARVFGNELYMTQFTSLNNLLNSKMPNKYSFKYFMESLSTIFDNKQIDYTKSFRLVNSEYVIPTVVGLPLRLEINSTATVGIQLNINGDVSSILKTTSGNFALFINPSAAMQVNGKMIVDAFFTQAGVETKGFVNSNTYLDVKLAVDKGQVVDISVNVPRDKVEIINVTSMVYVKHRDDLLEIEGVGEVYEHDSCSGKHVPTFSGMGICSQYTLKNASAVADSPYFPLTGRFLYALALQKSDDFTSYQLHLKQLFESSNGKHSGKFLLEVDTPGSKLNRRLLADMSFNTKNGDANLEVISPAGSFAFTGKLGLSTAEKSLDMKAMVDGKDYAAVKVALQTENTARTIRYEPSFFLQANPNLNVSVTGRLNIIPGSKYSADLTATGFTKQPVTFYGDVSGAKGRYSASLSTKAEAVDIKINSKLVNTPTVTSCKTLVRYVLSQKKMESVDFTAKLQNHKKGGFSKKQLWINFQMSELPEYSTKLTWVLYRTQKYIDSNVDLTFGKTQWKSQQLYHNNIQEKNKNFEVILSLESPTKIMDYRVEMQYKTTDETVHGHALAQLSKKKQFISRIDYEQSFPMRTLELELATPWKRWYLEGKLESLSDVKSEWTQIVNGTLSLKWGDIAAPQWVTVVGHYKVAEAMLSARHAVEASLEGQDLAKPVLFVGEWNAGSADGLILSDIVLTVIAEPTSYKLAVGYLKDPALGKHDLKVNITLPDITYSSDFLLINNQDIKNVTVRLDLEKSLYFTSQLQLWRTFDMQLFWNYLEDSSQSVLVKYRNSPHSEVAVVSMPGHYASLTVDKLGPGFSSMNITAIWGESEGSANNAILLSTFWFFDMSPWYAELLWLPTVQTQIHLMTPFIGFEQQSFMINMNGSSVLSQTGASVTRDIEISAKWQDQFIHFDFNQSSVVFDYLEYDQKESQMTLIGEVRSSVDFVKNANVKLKFQEKQLYGQPVSTLERSYAVNAAYNEWYTFVFNSDYLSDQLLVSLGLTNQAENDALLAGEFSLIKNSVVVKLIVPSNKKILFTSTYDWPKSCVANLTTPFKGYEESIIQYNIQIHEKNIGANISGRMGKDFLLFLANLNRAHSGFQGMLNISSSSSIPDVNIMMEHELSRKLKGSSIKEFASFSLIKNGKLMQFGKVLLSYNNEASSISSNIKRIETVLELPGFSSNSNYSHRTQLKLTGIENSHYLTHIWNKDKTEISLVYEGLTTISALLKRNNDKKAEMLFKNSENRNYRTDLALPGGYFVKHRLFFTEIFSWEHFFIVSSPTHKVIMKNLQTLNTERTNFVHKSTVSLDKEVAFVDLVINLDPENYQLSNIIFSTTTPWTHPVTAKYDLLYDTGATKKHEVQLKFKEDQEVKIEFYLTKSKLKYAATFNIQSPYCKHFGGTLNYENNESISKVSSILKMDEQYLVSGLELTKNIKNPTFSVSVNNTEGTIITVFCNYNFESFSKEAKFLASYFEEEVNFHGHYLFRDNTIMTGFILRTPLVVYKELSADLDAVLSQQYSMFAFNAKKDEQYIIVSGAGTFQNDLLKTSISLDYLLSQTPQKHSTVFEFITNRDSRLVSLYSKNNEINVIELYGKFEKEVENAQHSYTLTYNTYMPYISLHNSSLAIKLAQNDRMMKIAGNVSFNKWQSAIKGESTFNESGAGYLDVKLSALEHEIELYLKHVADEKDTYSWHLSNNEHFVSGSIIMSSINKNGDLKVHYVIDSSVDEVKNINGIVIIETSSDSFILESSSNVNSDNYIIKYKVNFGEDQTSVQVRKTKTQHTLLISVPIAQFENIRGTLEYGEDDMLQTYLIGEITDGNTVNKILFLKDVDVNKWNVSIDLPIIFMLSANKTATYLELSAKTSPSQVLPNFALNLSSNSTTFLLETENVLTGKVNLFVKTYEMRKLSVSATVKNLSGFAILEGGDTFLSFVFTSNIPKWSEVSTVIRHREVDALNRKFSISVSKEKEELLHSNIEGFYTRNNGDCLVSITMKNIFIDVYFNYDLSSNFSVDLKYNLNGNKQHAQGKISFLQDSTRIDLATPIRGFEDMTLIGNLNKKDKIAGLVFQNSGKSLNIELSAALQNKLIVLKGIVTNGKDEYILTVGAQNGTIEEPKSTSVYLNAFANKKSVLALSLEGSYDLKKRAGLKISYSSYYYKQLYFELLSLKEESKHTLLFNYIYGIDIMYLLKTTVISDIYKPHLIIDSQFGPDEHYLEVSYDVLSPQKTASVNVRQSKDKFINSHVEASFTALASSIQFVLENKDLLSTIDSLNISGGYDFTNKTNINSSFVIDKVNYFDVNLESNSLYSVEFHSHLLPSNYINTSYNTSLVYKLALPDATIFTIVNMNGEYYRCTANLTWNEHIVKTYFQLTTNSGYGFENAVLSSQYGVDEYLKHQHFIDFTVDDSKLFHISSAISYPNQFFINLVLPDSLFLPFVKEISVGFNFGEDKKSVSFRYKSGSTEERKLNLVIVLEDNHCVLELGRSEINGDNNVQSDDFVFLYHISNETVDINTSLTWENSNIFSVLYNRQRALPLVKTFFTVNHYHSWNITIAYNGMFMFAGNLNSSDISLHAKHPTTSYHQQSGISKIEYIKSIGTYTVIDAQYKNTDVTEVHLKYKDFEDHVMSLISKKIRFTTYTALEVLYNEKINTLHEEKTCEQFENVSSIPTCLKWEHSIKVCGLSQKPLGFHYEMNTLPLESNGTIFTSDKNVTFSGKAHLIGKQLTCPNFELSFSSSDEPRKPFVIKYETNCKNSFYANINIFNKDACEVRGHLEFNNSRLSGIKVEGKNIPYLKDVSVTSELSAHSMNVNFSAEKDSIQIKLHYSDHKQSVTIDSTNSIMRMLEVSRESDSMYQNYLGKFKIESAKVSTEWTYSVYSEDGSVVFHVSSDKNLQVEIVLDLKNKNEVHLVLNNNGKIYEGNGRINNDKEKISGNAGFLMDGSAYELSFQRIITSQVHEVTLKLNIPDDEYYAMAYMNKGAGSDTPFVIIKYKTPFHPFSYAFVTLRYSQEPIDTNGHISIDEIKLLDRNNEIHNTSYKRIFFQLSAQINNFSVENAECSVMYGDKYGTMLKYLSNELSIAVTFLKNNESHVLQGLIDVHGNDMPNFEIFKRRTQIQVYINKTSHDAFAVMETPLTDNILLSLKKEKNSLVWSDKNLEFEDTDIQRVLIVYGEKAIMKLDTLKTQRNTTNVSLYMLFRNRNQTVIDTKIVLSGEDTNIWMRSVELHVSKCFTIEAFNPKVTVKRSVSEAFIVQYQFNFTNGVQNEKLSFKGNCSLSYPELKSFSVDSNPSINANVVLESIFSQYTAISDVIFQRNKVDATLKWRRIMKAIKYNQNPEYSTLKFGGLLKKNSVEFYLNNNKFSGILENSDTQTFISANLFNENLKKNISVFASVEYSPVFVLNISHTVFDSPCLVEIKVDRRPLSVESAVTIVYNNLKQQAFLNGYLDSKPQYAEFIYIDIWQQTHDASIHVEEKDNEVTVRGKINSPALDENFMIVTIGNNNDKFDLNLNDAFIFKAFKDSHSGLLHILIFGNDYKVQYSCESDIKISVVSPRVNGDMTFSLEHINENFHLQGSFNVDLYHFLLEVNKNNIFTISLTKEDEDIFKTSMEFQNTKNIFQVHFKCNIYDFVNSLSVKHTHNPIRLVVSLNSPLFLENNLEIVLGMTNEDLITGIFEVKQKLLLFRSFLVLSKENRTLKVTFEAPLMSDMDIATINGIFNIIDSGDFELRLTGMLSSAETLLYHGSINFIKNEEILSAGLAIICKLRNYDDIAISFHLPLQLSRDMKVNFLVQVPLFRPFELGLTLCINENKVLSSAIVKLLDLFISAEFKNGDTPFYSDLYEFNLHYFQNKLQIGAWMKPKEPITDYIYFLDFNDKRIIEVSHVLILKQNHFKSKVIVETSFEGHGKYGIDLELQNLKVGKIIRLHGSVPKLGKDLGVDFGYSYENLLNYALLAQIRIPLHNTIKMARLYALHKIHPNLSLNKLNYSLECTDFGIIGWELETYGPFPFIWQEEMSAIDTKLTFNNKVYGLKTKYFLQSNKIQMSVVIETPFQNIRKGELLFSGTQQIVGSELVLSLNTNELININITQDVTNAKQVMILSKWRNMALSYSYEVDVEMKVSGFVCWDLYNKKSSQLGLTVKSSKDNQRYEQAIELLLPSLLIPKVMIKSAFKNSINEIFTLVQVDFPGVVLEGKLAREISTNMLKSGAQLKWTVDNSSPKSIGLFYVTENSEEDVKYYLTLQHFALENDLMLTVYIKSTVYGLNVQYSPVKDEEITLELGHWLVEDNNKERSGVKIVVLHPVTNTLIYTVANMTTTNEFSEGGFSVTYLSRQESSIIKFVEIYGKRNKKTPQIFIGLASNGNSLGIRGSVWQKENYLNGVTVEARVNQKDPFKLELIHNTANPAIEAELSYSLSRTYRLFAGMPNNNELTAKLSHTVHGKPNLDALASLRLNTSRLIWGRFELPPMNHVGQEFYNGVMEEYADFTLVSEAISNGFSDFLQEDFSEKINLFLKHASAKIDILSDQTSLEAEVVIKSLLSLKNIIHQVYNEDFFYVKTSSEILKRAGSAFYEHVACIVQIATDITNSLFSPVLNVAARVWDTIYSILVQSKMFYTEMVGTNLSLKQISNVVVNYQNLRQNMVCYAKEALAMIRNQLLLIEQWSADLLTQTELAVNDLSRSVEDLLSQQIQRLVNYKDTILAGFYVLGNTVEEMLGIVMDGIYRIKEVRESLEWLIKCSDIINNWFANFRIETYLKKVEGFIQKVMMLIISDFEKNFGEYDVYLVRTQQVLAGQYNEINKVPQVHYLKSAVNHVYQKVKWYWNYAKLNEKLREAMKKYMRNMKATLDEFEKQLDREEGDLRSEYTYNAENNSLTFTQELPFEWRAFNQLPEYDMDMGSSPLTIPAQEYTNMVQTMANYLWQDAKLLPYLLPPFGAEAIISGDSIVTFDNSFYRFSSNCNSFLLASDLYHNTFSLIVNYNQQNEREIILMSHDLEILIKNNLEIYVNGKLKNLPLKLFNGNVKLERKVHSIFISSEEGFNLECTSFQSMCKFHVDGWYVGKTAGLFGTYNNEPSDDFVSPSRQLSRNTKEFSSSWALDSNSCETKSDISVSSSSEDIRPYESMCELFFSSQSSPFFPCFHVINPKAFYDMCMTNTKADNTCSSVLAYLTKCTSSGVQLWMPDFCSDSSITDATLLTGYSDIIEIPSKMSADIILVVEKGECLDKNDINLATLAASLNSDLKAKGLIGNRFAFVSFGDEDAQIHTINGLVWTEDDTLISEIASKLEGVEGSSSLYQSALNLAASLPFRPGVTKIAILIHCSSCSYNENYASVLEKFDQNDITLHILQKENIMSKRGKIVSKAIGLEKSGAYPRKRLTKNVLPNPELLQQISVPQDLCTPIMIGTNGTLFNIDVTKKAMKAWSGRVAQGAIPPTTWKQCENVVGDDNIPTWRCRRTRQNTMKNWDQTALDEYIDTSRALDVYTEYEEVER